PRPARLFPELLAPLQRAGTAAGRSVADAWQGAAGLWRARLDAEALRARVVEVQRDTARLAAAERREHRARDPPAPAPSARGAPPGSPRVTRCSPPVGSSARSSW